MLLHRFQDHAGHGPWTGNGGSYAYNEAYQTGVPCNSMPIPHDDEGKEFREHYRAHGVEGWYFASASLEQLLQWFPCPIGRAAMKDATYNLVLLSVPRAYVRVGNTQCIYRPEHASLINTYDIVTLEKVS